jgi:hypothetical protein
MTRQRAKSALDGAAPNPALRGRHEQRRASNPFRDRFGGCGVAWLALVADLFRTGGAWLAMVTLP